MKISAAQVHPYIGEVNKNVRRHLQLIDKATLSGSDVIVFPELSLTGYEPKQSKKLAINVNDERLDIFQKVSNEKEITIGVGAPINSQSGIQIAMIFFQLGIKRVTYSKRYLHQDERPWFSEGDKQIKLEIGNKTATPAICYESMLPQHLEDVLSFGTDIYMASVAKSINGVQKAHKYFSKISAKNSIYVVMSNSVGPCDNFISAGGSAIWNRRGKLLGALNGTDEDILMMDIDTD